MAGWLRQRGRNPGRRGGGAAGGLGPASRRRQNGLTMTMITMTTSSSVGASLAMR